MKKITDTLVRITLFVVLFVVINVFKMKQKSFEIETNKNICILSFKVFRKLNMIECILFYKIYFLIPTS